MVPKTAPRAPCRPRDREPLFLGLCSKCREICCCRLSSLPPLLQAQNIASPKWLPTTYAPGLSKTAAYAAYCMDRFNYTDDLSTSCSPLPYCSTPICHITFLYNLLSIIRAHPKIIYHTHASVPISSSFLSSTLQSSPTSGLSSL